MLAGHMSFDIAVGGMAPGEAFAHSEVPESARARPWHPDYQNMAGGCSIAV
jgi:hypothetical protein